MKSGARPYAIDDKLRGKTDDQLRVAMPGRFDDLLRGTLGIHRQPRHRIGDCEPRNS
jgi:hypothetical protein